METEMLEINEPRRSLLAGVFTFSMTAFIVGCALFSAYCAGQMHARSQETAWLVDRAHRLEESAADDAAKARALLQGVQAEKETYAIRSEDAGQVSSL